MVSGEGGGREEEVDMVCEEGVEGCALEFEGFEKGD